MRSADTQMNSTVTALQEVQRVRKRAMIIPREHGAWGLLLVPLFTGVVAGFAPEHRFIQLLMFTVVALSLFWLRTPAESLIGTSPISASTEEEQRTALLGCVTFGAIAALCLIPIFKAGESDGLHALGAVTGALFVAQALIRKLGRRARMSAQLIGAIGLTCTAPAAYYVGTGRLDGHAFVLWVTNWLFAANQIHFVQLRIRSARTTNLSARLTRGKFFLFAQSLLLVALMVASIWRFLPPLVIIAFLPALARGMQWFLRESGPLDVKRLGWSEMRQGIAFGILLSVAFIYP